MQGCNMKVKSTTLSQFGNDHPEMELPDLSSVEIQLSEQSDLDSLFRNQRPDYFSISTEDVTDA